VSVADIATTAEVSKPTHFGYFASKEDLVLHRIADHHGEAARVVRDRAPGVAPLTALHRHFRADLETREQVTGLNDRRGPPRSGRGPRHGLRPPAEWQARLSPPA
jgi:AcrR family transcriptional regulator